MIELSRAQDEEVGDGTTSVIILAGEVLAAVEGFLERDIHPTVIVGAYFKALDDLNSMTRSMSVSIPLHSFLPPIPMNDELTDLNLIGAHQHGG